MINSKQFYGGTSGLVLPVAKENIPAEYADKSRLELYAAYCNTLEVNSSFYKLPRKLTVRRWAENTPAHFVFTFKLSKVITHVKNLEFSVADVMQFLEVINEASNKKGCILVQFPAGLKATSFDVFQALMNLLQSTATGWNLAVEFRDTSWYNEQVYSYMRALNIALVQHDMPNSATPGIATASFNYYRFHGPDGTYRGSYSNETLISYAGKLQAGIEQQQTTFCYFNNTMGAAMANLQYLRKLVIT